MKPIEWAERGTELEIKVRLDLTRDVANCTVETFEKMVRSAMIEELEKSPEFKEMLRKLALERLVVLLDSKYTR